MKIGIDGRLAGARHAGIGRYITQLLQRLPSLAPEVEWVYFFHDKAQATEVLGTKVTKSVTVVLAPVRHYSLAEQWQWLQIVQKADLDLLHVPHFNVPVLYTRPMVVTIHDLLWHEYRGSDVTTLSPMWYWIKYWAYRWVASHAITQAKRILVPAETIKQILTKYYPQVSANVLVTKEGVAPEFVKAGQLAAKSRAIQKSQANVQKVFLYVGSLYPHKNVDLIIKTLPRLPEYQLWLVGARNVFQDRIKKLVKELQVESQVKFLGYVPDDQLVEYFTKVSALVQPSMSEGFGLTGVEALAANVPVLASDIPIFHEIYQDAAIYFDPHHVESFEQAVQTLEQQSSKIFEKKAQVVAGQYDWQDMAERTLAAYRSAVSK